MSHQMEKVNKWINVVNVETSEKLDLYQGPSTSIYVGPEKVLFTAPKALLIQQSQFFDKTLGGSFKEAATNEVFLSQYDPDAFKHILHYMLTGNLGVAFTSKGGNIDSNWIESSDKETRMEKGRAICWTLCQVFYHADTLLMSQLKEHACSLLSNYFEEYYWNCGAGAENPLEQELVIDVFENTMEGSELREIILTEIKLLLLGKKGRSKVDASAYQECFRKVPEFAVAVVGDFANALGAVEEKLGTAEAELENRPVRERSPRNYRGRGRVRGRRLFDNDGFA